MWSSRPLCLLKCQQPLPAKCSCHSGETALVGFLIFIEFGLFSTWKCVGFFSLLELKVLIICRLSSIRLSVNFHICVLFSALPISSAVFTSLSMSIPPHFQDQVIRHICKVHQHLNWKEKVEIDSETKRSHHKGYI